VYIATIKIPREEQVVVVVGGLDVVVHSPYSINQVILNPGSKLIIDVLLFVAKHAPQNAPNRIFKFKISLEHKPIPYIENS